MKCIVGGIIKINLFSNSEPPRGTGRGTGMGTGTRNVRQ